MKSNALFNTLFLAFSFAVIAVASGKINLNDSLTTNAQKNEVVYEQEYALNTNMSKAIYQHKI